MFGAKKRQYRKTVAQVIAGMALPSDIEEQTQKLYILLKSSIDQYYSRDMLPVQAAIMIIYQILKNLHINRDTPHSTSALDEYKETFVSAAASLLGEDVQQLLSDEIYKEVEIMLEEIGSSKIYSADVITYGEVVENAIARQRVIKSMMNSAGI